MYLVIEPIELIQRNLERLAKYGILFSPAIQPSAFTNHSQQLCQQITKLKNVANLDELASTLNEVYFCPQNVFDLMTEFEKAIQALPEAKQTGRC